jgi:hypothetical protein
MIVLLYSVNSLGTTPLAPSGAPEFEPPRRSRSGLPLDAILHT